LEEKLANELHLPGIRMRITGALLLRRLFLCEQPLQHLVSRLVARRITFGKGYELAVALDILVLGNVALRPPMLRVARQLTSGTRDNARLNKCGTLLLS